MNEEQYYNLMQEQSLAGQLSDTSNKQMQQQYFMEEKEKGMIETQLSMEEVLDRINHFLRAEIPIFTDKGEYCNICKRYLKQSTDPDVNVLTEAGREFILSILDIYLNKNTLLSNFDAPTINVKMRDFSSAFNKTMFMEYKTFFKQPTMEECQKVLRERIERKSQLRQFGIELLGGSVNEETLSLIKKDLFLTYEGKIEKELENIRQSLSSNKNKRYLIINRVVQDAVHSTYNRAYMGMERKTLREHIHVSETKGGLPVQQNKGGGIFGWLKG